MTTVKFKAGNIKHCIKEWEYITNDKHVLETVKGCKIDFERTPYQSFKPKPLAFSDEECVFVEQEIENMLDKGVIIPSTHEQGEYISNIFLRPKKDGSHRVILNLKSFNEFVKADHFKMDSIMTCLNLMTKDCYMASIDLKDAYYSVPVAIEDQKFLKFEWNGRLYQYTCLAMGLACAPRKFVKLLKPVFAFLHGKGYVSSGYLDDTFIQGDTREICEKNVEVTIELLRRLGFYVHIDKSVTVPQQELEHLGFILNAKDMTIALTDEKHEKLKVKIDIILNKNNPSIREVASAVGSMVSYMPAVQYGSLFYKQIEIEKIEALKQNHGNFDKTMTLSPLAKEHARWWKSEAPREPTKINVMKFEHTLCTDASLDGWGATREGLKCGGRWLEKEKTSHINELELIAIEFGLKSLCGQLRNTHIRIKTDNTTAVAYVQNMGGCKSVKCNAVAQRIWTWAIDKNIWLTITHIEGRLNTEPDKLSREFTDNTEWMLNPTLFKLIQEQYMCEIDLFASRLNKQLNRYMSWQPDPQAEAVDAFAVDWSLFNSYIFPPFSMLPRVLMKLEEDQANAVVIAPLWTAQSWFPKLIRLLREPPRLLPRGKRQLGLPFNIEKLHPLWRKMHLLAWPLSGQTWRNKVFVTNLRRSYSSPGDQEHKNNIKPICLNGQNIAIDGVSIPILPI